MKKLIGFILLLAALCVCFSAYAAENGSGDHLTWELDEKGTLTISGTGDMDKTFNQNAEIKAVVIGNGITRVCDSAFYFCENLKSVSFPNSLKEIGNYVFYGCTKLTGVTLPASLNSIGTSAFGYCPGMTGITIPNQVKTIGDSAFGDITIYARLGTDGAKALGKAGISFRVPNGQYQLRYRYEGDRLQDLEVIAVDNGVTKLVIPKGVTRIAAYAFSDNNVLTDVVIPDGVKSIGQDAFASCSGIKNLVIPASVTSIEKGAFSHWNGNLVFQGAAPAIDSEAFYYGSVVAVYPHDRSGWDTAAKKSFAAKWINWQADNAEAAKDTKPRTQTETLTQTLTDNESDHNYGWNWADTTDSYLDSIQKRQNSSGKKHCPWNCLSGEGFSPGRIIISLSSDKPIMRKTTRRKYCGLSGTARTGTGLIPPAPSDRTRPRRSGAVRWIWTRAETICISIPAMKCTQARTVYDTSPT